MYVVVSNLIPQTTALQFEIAVRKEQKCVLFYTAIINPHELLPGFPESKISSAWPKEPQPTINCTVWDPIHLLSESPNGDILKPWNGDWMIRCEWQATS